MTLLIVKKILRPIYVPIITKMQEYALLIEYRRKYRLHIMSSVKTIEYIRKNHCSLARFGDGEISMMLNKEPIGFQDSIDELADKLREVYLGDKKDLLIALPSCLTSLRGMKKESSRFWKSWCIRNNNYLELTKLLQETVGNGYRFGDTMVTRPYMDWRSTKRASIIFAKLKTIWNGKDILIVEGEQTRLGVGNDLFCNVKSIVRILAPPKNAFQAYNNIISTIKKEYKGQLVLLALGPTATVLASELSTLGIQAIDVGHVDVEYMWYLKKAKIKTAIPGKYINEVSNGHSFTKCEDTAYNKQIIARIEIPT